MPVTNGEYDALTADEIRSNIESDLQAEFGNDIDLTESSVFSTLSEVLATVLANNQEQSLQEVYQSAFLETAEGQNLDRVVAIIGLQRRSAVHATGVERFFATGPVTQDYIIQGGTVVQTDGDDPIEFETTEPTALEFIDSFEGGSPLSDYSGTVASASVVADANAPHGSNALEMDATAGAHIYDENITIKQGTTFHGWVNPATGAQAALTFGNNLLDTDDYYQVVLDEPNDQVLLERVDNGAVGSTIDTLSSAGLTAGSYHEVEIDWSVDGALGVTVYDPNDNELGTLGGTDDTYEEGHPGFKSLDATTTKRFDWYTTSEVSANIRAIQGGTRGNVGPNSITKLPSPPAGVDTITNLQSTGDIENQDTNGSSLAVGQAAETDSELRARAEEAVSGGGAATHDAIVGALINDTDGVTSVTVYENKTDTDNTGTGGLPPHSFEVVVFGGNDEDVAQTIFDKKAVTARDYGGAHGSSVTITVTSDVNGQERDITYTRPTEQQVDMTLDLAVDKTYVGNDSIRDQIVQYVGGILSNGNDVVGLGVGEDVIIDRITDIVVGEENGVVGLDQSVDSSPITTTPSITTVNGLQVVDIGANEVAQTDAGDGSITINTRTV